MRRHGGPGRDATGTAAVLAAAVVTAVTVAALLAGHVPDRPPASRAADTSSGAGVVESASPAGSGVAWAWAVYLGVLLALLGVLGFYLLREGIRPAPRADRPADVDAAAEADRARVAAAVDAQAVADAALAAAADALAAGAEPREVVIACWVRIETAAEAAGRGRRPAETATDVARRWLAGEPDRAAVDTLARLYHEARYSAHPMTDADRAAALDALHRLRATVGGRA